MNVTDYRQGDDPNPVAAAFFYGGGKIYLNRIAYYVGDTATGDLVSAASIAALDVGKTFTAVLIFEATPSIVFVGSSGRKDYRYTRHFKVQPKAYRVDRIDRTITIAWSADPTKTSAPELTSDIFVQASEYGAGSVLKTTITSKTEPGDKMGTITFAYPANSGSGARVEVTYSVNVVKSVLPRSWPSANQGTVVLQAEVLKGND